MLEYFICYILKHYNAIASIIHICREGTFAICKSSSYVLVIFIDFFSSFIVFAFEQTCQADAQKLKVDNINLCMKTC